MSIRHIFIFLVFVGHELNNDELVKKRLNEKLFSRIQQIEFKRMKDDKEALKERRMSQDQRYKLELKRKKEELLNIGRNATMNGVSVTSVFTPTWWLAIIIHQILL